ncbi:MAG: hypothetical protein ACE5FF_12875 [Saprospiraceae bacterium]
MTENRLIKLLSKLNRKEMTRFAAFASSPYFNKHEGVIALANYLSTKYPEFNGKTCNREVIFQKIFPHRKHDQAKLAVLFTYGFRLLRQFLILEQAKSENIFENHSLLLRSVRQRGIFYLFKNYLEENIDGGNKFFDKNPFPKTGTSPPFDSQYFEARFKTLGEMDAHATLLGKHHHNYLSGKQGWLDAFYLSEKLRDACELMQRSKVMKVEFPEDPMLTSIHQTVSQHSEVYAQYPSVVIYSHIYTLLKSNDATFYAPTIKVVEENEHQLSKPEVQSIYNHLQNFCIAQINRGDNEFLQELFGLYRKQLSKELLLADGQLPEWHFKNIVTVGLRLEEFEWVRSFLETYRHFLKQEVADNAYSYNLAAWHYHQRKYPQVLDLLLKIEYTDLRYSLDAKSMLLRTYYDLEEEEALLALCEAFKQFIKRNRKLSDFQKKGYFNLLKFTRRAFKLKLSKGYTLSTKWQRDFTKLTQEVADAETVFNKTWLEDKMEELNPGFAI